MAPLCLASNRYQPRLSLLVYFELTNDWCSTSRRYGGFVHDAIAAAVVIEFKRILAGTDIALVGAAQAEPFQVPDQIPVATARLSKGSNSAGTKKRNYRGHCLGWGGVKISFTSLEIKTLVTVRNLPACCRFKKETKNRDQRRGLGFRECRRCGIPGSRTTTRKAWPLRSR